MISYKMGFTIEEVIAHWDRVAPIYDDANAHELNPHHWRFIEGVKHVKASNSPEIKVLSIWSRTGDAIPYILSKLPLATIYNFEASPRMREIAQKKYPDEQFFETDLNSINLDSECVDYILSPETLEHTPNPPELLKEFYRVLKPGGTLVLSLPPRIADFHQWIYETIVGGHGDGPRRGIPSSVVKRMLAQVGFYIDRHKSILLLPIGPLWFIELGNKITERFPLLREFGVMQFYICTKGVVG